MGQQLISCTMLWGFLWHSPLRYVCQLVLFLFWFSKFRCGVLMSCTDWQIYGDGTTSSRDCFKMFNPTDLASYNVSYLKTSEQLSLHTFYVYLIDVSYSFTLKWFPFKKKLSIKESERTFRKSSRKMMILTFDIIIFRVFSMTGLQLSLQFLNWGHTSLVRSNQKRLSLSWIS